MQVLPSGDEIVPDIVRLRSCATFPGNDLRVDSPWPCEFDFLGVKEPNFWGFIKNPQSLRHRFCRTSRKKCRV